MKGSLFINPVLYRYCHTNTPDALYVKRAKKASKGYGWFQPVKHYDNTEKAVRYVSDGLMVRYSLESMYAVPTPCS